MTLAIEGELDAASADALDRELERAEESNSERIVLDLSGLGFIDSRGVRTLLIAARRSSADSDRLTVIPASGQVAKVLELTGLDRVLGLAE